MDFSKSLNFLAGRKKKILTFLLRILLIYAVVVIVAYIFQNRMIYMPRRAGLAEIRNTAAIYGLRLWPEDTIHYQGFVLESSLETAKGTIIVFHGNAGSALDRSYYLQPLQQQGFRVLLAEYPGYGARQGRTGEISFVANGRETVEATLNKYREPVYIWGESLGCGIASAIAADPALRIDGLVLLTPWNTLSDTAQVHYWFLPARWLVRDRFDNVRNLKQFSGPVAVIMAEGDRVIPNRLTRTLYRSIASSKRLWTFESAGHNSWPANPELGWWREVMEFVSRNQLAPDTSK
jgi:pimeloyl-ACP methyl ester carboxylesterase